MKNLFKPYYETRISKKHTKIYKENGTLFIKEFIVKRSGRPMGKKILIVDDDDEIRATIKLILEKNGYSVATAVNGTDCLKKLDTEKPDLILLDIMMPGAPTREIVNKIKNTKIAYLTAVRVSEAERESLLTNKNIVDFIQKPFDLNDLLKRIKKALA